jgi:hypothetical protein
MTNPELGRLKADLIAKIDPMYDRPSGHPYIDENTYNALANEYNIGENQDPWIGLRHPYYKGLADAEEYFQSLGFQDGDDTRTLGELYAPFLAEYFKGSDTPNNHINTASVGIGFILKANHILQGPHFYDRLRTMPASRVQAAINESMKGKRYITDRVTVVGRQNPPIQIPKGQVFLLKGLEAISKASSCNNCLIDGALSAYNTVENLWPDLRRVPTAYEEPHE